MPTNCKDEILTTPKKQSRMRGLPVERDLEDQEDRFDSPRKRAKQAWEENIELRRTRPKNIGRKPLEETQD
jgi:hypothetical protein